MLETPLAHVKRSLIQNCDSRHFSETHLLHKTRIPSRADTWILVGPHSFTEPSVSQLFLDRRHLQAVQLKLEAEFSLRGHRRPLTCPVDPPAPSHLTQPTAQELFRFINTFLFLAFKKNSFNCRVLENTQENKELLFKISMTLPPERKVTALTEAASLKLQGFLLGGHLCVSTVYFYHDVIPFKTTRSQGLDVGR